MSEGKVPIISSDSHVVEPPELWKERLPKDMRHRAPHVEVRDGVQYVIVEGTHPRKMGSGRTPLEGEALLKAQAGGWDPAARLKDQDRDGVTGEVIYPTNGLTIFLSPDPALQMAMARAYNDWAYEIFAGYPRLAVAPLIPTCDIDLAIAEAQRVAGMGFRSVFLPMKVVGRPQYNDPIYDRLWAAIQETGLPINFHVGTGHENRGERGPGGAVINYLLHAQADGAYIACYLSASGVLERFPGIQAIAVETGCAWLGWVLMEMDHIYQKHAQWVQPKLKMLPGEYWRRQGHVTFMHDPVGVATRHFTGISTLLWGNDYPHAEGTWPHSQEALRNQFRGVPEEEVLQIAGGTAAKLYKF